MGVFYTRTVKKTSMEIFVMHTYVSYESYIGIMGLYVGRTLFVFMFYITMMKCNAMEWIALVLTVIGGINWGLVGAFDLDLVAAIFGSGVAADIIYIIVGLAAIYMIVVALSKKDGASSSMQM